MAVVLTIRLFPKSQEVPEVGFLKLELEDRYQLCLQFSAFGDLHYCGGKRHSAGLLRNILACV